MREDTIILVILQILSIIAIWIRLESRLSRLEGRFDMFVESFCKTIESLEKRRGP